MRGLREFRRRDKLMGSAFEFVLLAGADEGEILIDEAVGEVKRIEYLLTEFSETSDTTAINHAAGNQAIMVDPETHSLIERALRISRLTQGAFDLTAAVLKRLYNFKAQNIDLPDRELIRQTLKKVGYQQIVLGKDTVRLAREGMHINFAAIGKGYAADRVKALLIARGVKAGVISASGDLTAWGSRMDGSAWNIGIADPASPSQALFRIPFTNCSIATSGDYEQYFMHHGKRYAHTIDPKTGLPVRGVKSVSVVSPSAELSDALATAVFVMGPKIGFHLIEQLPDTHALMIRDNNQVMMTSHLKLQQHEAMAA